jgi:hypothetical protein
MSKGDSALNGDSGKPDGASEFIDPANCRWKW